MVKLFVESSDKFLSVIWNQVSKTSKIRMLLWFLLWFFCFFIRPIAFQINFNL